MPRWKSTSKTAKRVKPRLKKGTPVSDKFNVKGKPAAKRTGGTVSRTTKRRRVR